MQVATILRTVQYVGFVGAIISNLLLLFLIHKRAGKSFGRYRIMMISFSVYAIFYSCVEVLTQPVMHVYGASLLFYVNSVLKHDFNIGVFFCIMYCGSFALCISMLATHFIYRYIAVSKNHLLYYFEGGKMYLWFLPPLLLFCIWGSSVFANFHPSDFKRDYFRNMTSEIYGEDIDQIAFIGILYFTYGEDGNRIFRPTDILGACLSCVIMSCCFSTCLTCAVLTYKKLNDVSIRMSKRTRELNRQLFWTLGLQTLLPCCTQYIPVGLIFLLPFLEFEIGKIGNFVGVGCCMYPALDPLVAIFMIDRFRTYLFKKKTAKVSGMSTFSSDASSADIQTH